MFQKVREWLALKNYQYQVTTGIYMLEPWERTIFSILCFEVFLKIAIDLMQLKFFMMHEYRNMFVFVFHDIGGPTLFNDMELSLFSSWWWWWVFNTYDRAILNRSTIIKISIHMLKAQCTALLYNSNDNDNNHCHHFI